ncbi:MAG: hypothetical protein WA919_04700 [Coleofasciculaceae cyanobacterium]
MSDKIIYPSIDLFLYDLKKGLGQDENKINQNCQQFCNKIYNDVDKATFQEKYAQIQKRQSSDADITELLETKTRDFPPHLDGWYYPLQMSDTYALQVNYSGERDADHKPNYEPQPLANQPFAQLKQEIEQRLKHQTGTIGQTWLLWGNLPENKSDTEIENIAKDCYTQIVSNYDWNRDFIGKGSLLEGTIFELWYCPKNQGLPVQEFWQKFRKESHHVLIWLFPRHQTPNEMRKQVPSVYHDFLNLFQYRHKIVWAYYQSRQQKNRLKQEYIEIQPSIELAKQLPKQSQENKLKLKELQKHLTNNLINLSDYTIALNYLENQIHTIEVNLYNYQSRIAEMAQNYPNSDLQFLKTFSDRQIYAKKYQRQVEADYASFNPGLTLLQNLNNTIQGIIELEQTKSDRALDNTIALVGIGLAVSGLTATVAVEYLEKPKDYSAQDLSIFLSPAFLWSLLVCVPFLIIWFVRFFRR